MAVILKTAVDTSAWEARPKSNYGKATRIYLSGTSQAKYGYVFFARPFPLGVTVESAILRLRLGEAWSGANTLKAQRITQGWSESKLTWNNKPPATSTNEGSVSVATLPVASVVEIDVTAMMGDVAAGVAWGGFRLIITAAVSRSLISSEHPTAELRPELEVSFSEKPQPPSNLRPGGNLAISKTKPLLAWDFVDTSGNTLQAWSQVQTSLSADFTTPNYDSGKVANTEPQWDLGPTAFPALADGATRYWRVRVWDQTNFGSDWSEIQQFQRQSQGALTIVNPDPAPANQVEETTPPITWSLAGRTQESYSVEIFRLNPTPPGGSTFLASSGLRAGTDSEWNIPPGIIRTGDTYVTRVRTYDSINRQGVVGDPAYVEKTATFTYVRSTTGPATVTGLTATADGAKVRLAFSRSTHPDYFALKVNGREVYDRLEPSDLDVGGNNFAFDYWLAKPRRSATYEIEAVVLDLGELKHSAGNPTATATTRPLGIWLADSVDSLGVFVAGKEKASMGIGEVSALFDVSGSRRPVRVTDVIQGYEGSFNGILLEPEDRDVFLELKGRLAPLRLIIGDLNIPVELGEVSVIPAPGGELSGYDVSFAFAQVGEFGAAFEVAGE